MIYKYSITSLFHTYNIKLLLTCFLFQRTRHLKCERQTCEELVVAHLGFLDYSYYIITVRFHGLESFHQRYNICDLTFYVSKHYIKITWFYYKNF